MVFRYSLEESKIRRVGEVCESSVTFDLQDRVMAQLSMYLGQDLKFIQENWHMLVQILLARNISLKDISEGLLGKEMHISCLDSVGLKNKNPKLMTRNGENQNGQASDDSFLPGLHDDTALDILAWSSRSGYPTLSCLNKKFRSLIASGYLYKLRRRLGVVEHWVYLACILMPWEAFDPIRQRWMRLPRMQCDECFTSADKESLAVGTQLLVFGRELSGFAIWMYSVITNSWSRCPQMNLPRCLFGSSSLGEIAIIAGGTDKNGRILKSAELYNSELGTWETLPDMNLPRKLCSGFFMDGKFYVIGGMSSPTESLTCGEEYNLETRTWRRIENMYSPSNVGTQSHPAMCSPPLVAVVDNQLYSADQATNEVKKYNKTNNSWNVVKRLPVRADSFNGWGLAFKACGDRLLVIGGHRGSEGEVIVLHSWDPADGNGDGPEWNVLAVKERAEDRNML
ncbi:F-box/kelch-repeat protein [Melia azedarach]|uniref:F-box/kelch-repeat protein n=1 Tax=Melia azedarach TaxID=155640 RepID=A0ACC1YB08_MELAZ|nr:F-box/kelch-repeat protein [Melia azedarach]